MHNFSIGDWFYDQNTVYNTFYGKIDDVGLWNKALEPCEIQDLYNAQLNSTLFTFTQNGSILTADQSGASYQWNQCSGWTITELVGETNQSYNVTTIAGYYQVVVNMNGCIGNSQCTLIDFTGIEEVTMSDKKLIKIVDLMGRETEFKPNTPLIYIYTDGTREKIIKIEN